MKGQAVHAVAQGDGEAAAGKASAEALGGAGGGNLLGGPLANSASGQTAPQGDGEAVIGHSATESAGADAGTPVVASSPDSSSCQLLDRPHPSDGVCAAPSLSSATTSAVKGAGVGRGAKASGIAANTAVSTSAAHSPSRPYLSSPWREGCPAAYSLHQLQQEVVLELQVRWGRF